MSAINLSRYALIAALATVSITLLLTPAPSSATPGAAEAEIVDLARALGLTPQSLVVTEIAGSETAPVGVLLGRLAGANALRASLLTQQAAADDAGSLISEIEQVLRVDGSDPEIVQQYDNTVASLNAANSQTASIQAQLLDLALDGFPSAQIESLATWRSSLPYDVPDAFRVQTRSPDEWEAVVHALRAEQRAIRRDEPFDGPDATLLAGIRNDQAVIEAENRLALDLASVEQAFEQFELPAE